MMTKKMSVVIAATVLAFITTLATSTIALAGSSCPAKSSQHKCKGQNCKNSSESSSESSN